MNDVEFRAFLNLLMCSDPYPGGDRENDTMVNFAIKQSALWGYASWEEAFHQFIPEGD